MDEKDKRYYTCYEDFLTQRMEPVIKEALTEYGKRFGTATGMSAVCTALYDIAITMSIAYGIEPQLLIMDLVSTVERASGRNPQMQAKLVELAAARAAGKAAGSDIDN